MAGTEPFLSASWYRVAGLRPQLSEHAHIRLHRYRGKPWYVVSDTAAGRVHRLTPAALGIVAAMDGQRTLDAIWQEAATRQGDDAPTQDQVLALMSQLHANDLLKADAVPDTAELLDRFAQTERRQRKGLLNPMNLRIRLWNPDRFITRAAPVFGPLFSLPGLLLWLLLVVPASVLAGQHWTALTTDVGDRVLAADNLLLLLVCLPLTKLLHEFGHGFATKRYGGAVPEIGIMFLIMIPMPYVDASAAAGFRSRARRVVVGAAGMMVEGAVAAIAMFVWVSVEPGFVRSMAFNILFATSVTTVLFNANPLMRYDGYYILSDLIEVPNLAQRATRFWCHLAERYVFARQEMRDFAATVGERAWFLFYAPASTAYRLSVTFGIALFLAEYYWAVGVALAAWSLATSVLLPVGKAVWHVLASPGLQPVRARAVATTFGGLGIAGAVLMLAPAPHHTMAEGVVWLPETAVVRAGAEGFVQRLLAEPGRLLPAGSPVVESADPALQARLDGLRGRVAELRSRLQAEQFSKLVDALVTRTELMQAEQELGHVEQKVRGLVARSMDAGVLAISQAADLQGRFLKEGDLIGYVLPPEGGRVVRATVTQDDIGLVRTQLRRAEVQVAGHPDQVFTTQIVREVPSGRDTLPSKALGTAGGGAVPVDPRDTKGLRTLRRTFQIDIVLPPGAPGDAFGTRVHVRLEHEWEPVGEQVYRRVRQLLLSRLEA